MKTTSQKVIYQDGPVKVTKDKKGVHTVKIKGYFRWKTGWYQRSGNPMKFTGPGLAKAAMNDLIERIKDPDQDGIPQMNKLDQLKRRKHLIRNGYKR